MSYGAYGIPPARGTVTRKRNCPRGRKTSLRYQSYPKFLERQVSAFSTAGLLDCRTIPGNRPAHWVSSSTANIIVIFPGTRHFQAACCLDLSLQGLFQRIVFHNLFYCVLAIVDNNFSLFCFVIPNIFRCHFQNICIFSTVS